METLNLQVEKTTTAFEASLMKAILATFQTEGNSNEFGDFDKINAVYAELTELLVKSPVYRSAVEDMQSDPDTAAIIRERYPASIPALETLLNLPKNSLGYVYASSLQEAGLKPLDLDPNLFSLDKVDSDVSYVEYRYQITHDLWHVVTGFDTSPIGELGLQAFYLAQFRLPSALIALVGGLIGSLVTTPEALPVLLTTIEQGWQMGKKAKQLIAQKWEEGWDKSVSQWQAELNVQPVN